MRVATIILAGGRSSRMSGGDKPLLGLEGKPILAHVLARLQPTDAIAINANGDPARFAAFGLPMILDATDTFDGPLAGILAGLRWAEANGSSRLLTVAGDTPFFPTTLSARLLAAGDNATIAVAASSGRIHPTFAVWPVALHADLVSQLDSGMRRVVDFIALHPSIAVDFPPFEAGGAQVDPFFNINTPEDLAEAREIAQKLGA